MRDTRFIAVRRGGSSTQAGEAKRHDDKFSHVSCWEFTGVGNEPVLHKEPLVYESVHASIRSYA